MPAALATHRRSPAYRWHQYQGATFKVVSDCETPAHYGSAAAIEAKIALQLAAIDLSALPRCGFKGPGTIEWLKSQGIVIPDDYNKARRQSDGSLALRCGSTDILIAGDVTTQSNLPIELKAAHGRCSQEQIGYDALREEGYAWFMLIGERTPDLMAQLCEVDMRSHVFSDLDIAQIRLANLAAIVARCDVGMLYAAHLFFDIASSVYFCEVVSELLRKLGGSFIGHDCLLAVDHQSRLNERETGAEKQWDALTGELHVRAADDSDCASGLCAARNL
jgi:sarcosine oxidase, subunit gamma